MEGDAFQGRGRERRRLKKPFPGKAGQASALRGPARKDLTPFWAKEGSLHSRYRRALKTFSLLREKEPGFPKYHLRGEKRTMEWKLF